MKAHGQLNFGLPIIQSCIEQSKPLQTNKTTKKHLGLQIQNKRDADIKNEREKPETEICERKMELQRPSPKNRKISNGKISCRKLHEEASDRDTEQSDYRERERALQTAWRRGTKSFLCLEENPYK